MNFIKSIIFSLVLVTFFGGYQLSAESAPVSSSAETSIEDVPAESKILEFLGELSQAQNEDLQLVGISCSSAKFLCGPSDCCHWVKKTKGESCDSLCPKAEGFCKKCPSQYKTACDLGCKYVKKCSDLCPCLKKHCHS